MAQRRALLKILLICPWVVPLAALRASLRAEGLAAEIVRVDFHAALRVALVHERFVAAFYTPTPGMSVKQFETSIREHAPWLTVFECDRIDQVTALLAQLLRDQQA